MGMIDLDVLTLDEPIKRIIEVCKYKILQVEDAIFLVDENQVIFSSLASFVTDRSPVRNDLIFFRNKNKFDYRNKNLVFCKSQKGLEWFTKRELSQEHKEKLSNRRIKKELPRMGNARKRRKP